ncbi:SDR family NAD(P)-dependent oxidoreductase, partial [Escherichia coli]|nr:SDR family NAD(P)-dependent oxidoreductase [Escherichia coli]
EEQKPEVWQQVMQVNVNGTFMLTQALLPLLLRSESGSLVFTSSSVGRQGRANWGAYAVSKFATEGMMQVLADEYQSR